MAESTTIIIFGASGDLTDRKLAPALFSLFLKERISGDLRIVGASTTPMSHEAFRARLREGLGKFAAYDFPEEKWQDFAGRLYYVPSSGITREGIATLKKALEELEPEPANRLYYLATPPRIFADIVARLGEAGMVKESGDAWRRVIFEKPFGRDLASAEELNRNIHEVLREEQIYRIDHYLGKETVQNLFVFRFANAIFEPIWNRNFIDNVQITVAEDVGVEHRGKYYDSYGVLRDMFQNHLLQLLTLIAMEPPVSLDADSQRNEKVKVLRAIRPVEPSEAAESSVRGQYRGYRREPNVAPDSQMATYAAIRLYVDNWRWQGVPFYLRSGKMLNRKASEVVIQFKCPPHVMFDMPSKDKLRANTLGICLQPDEGMHLQFEVKVPDTVAKMRSVDMEMHYRNVFPKVTIPEAYERLLLDALHGDAALFTRNDQIELSWRIIDQFLRGWHVHNSPPLVTYDPGTWGPAAADEFIQSDGNEWLFRCVHD